MTDEIQKRCFSSIIKGIHFLRFRVVCGNCCYLYAGDRVTCLKMPINFSMMTSIIPGMHPLNPKAPQHRAFQTRRFHRNQMVHCILRYLLFWPVLAVDLWLCCLFSIKTEMKHLQKIWINDSVLNLRMNKCSKHYLF